MINSIRLLKNLKWIIILALMVSFRKISFCQNLSNEARFLFDSCETYTYFSSELQHGSSQLTNGFMDKLIYGGFISENEINQIIPGKNINNIGIEFNTELAYFNPNQTIWKDWGLYLGIRYQMTIGAEYTNDAFDLIFKGNANFLGQNMNLTRSGFHLRESQTFFVGINQFNKTKIGLSITNLSKSAYGIIERGTFFTDTLAQRMSLDLNGNGYYNLPGTTPLFNAGFGIGLEYETSVNIEGKKRNYNILFGLRNLGLTINNKSTNYLTVDSVFKNKGTAVNTIADFGTNQGALNIDSSFISNNMKRHSLSPFEIYFYLPLYDKPIKIKPLAGFRYRPLSNYKPLFYLGTSWQPTVNHQISIFATHGGFAGLQLGLNYAFQIKAFYIGVGSNNLIGNFSDKFFGKSVHFSVSYRLKK